MELTKRDTKMIQGLSVMAMLCLHLFDRLDYEGLFQPIIFLGKLPLTFYLGQLSDFCVMGFAFCSGYAHMLLYSQEDYYKNRLKGIARLLCNYWTIIFLFTMVSLFVGKGEWMPGSWKTLLLNVLLLESSYNGAWWYMLAYVVLVGVSPLLLKMVKRYQAIVVIGGSFIIYCITYYIRFNMATTNWILIKVGPLGMTLFEYLLGAVWCDKKIFTKLSQQCKKINNILKIAISVMVFITMLLARTLIIPSLFVAPITGIIIICFFFFWKKPLILEKCFLMIGKHSTNIWLTHMFFYLNPFTNLVYIMKYPILIYIFMLTITLMVSVILQKIEKPLEKKLL